MRPQVFKLEKNFENREIHQRRRSAWVGQADFGKLELNNRNHSGNCQCLSGKRDQFEDLWNNRRNFLTFALGVVNGRGCYCSSPFQRFYENPIQASNSQAYNPSPFQRFYGNSLQASQLHSTQASTVRGLLFSELNAVFAAKHFIFFIFPILLKLKKKENDPMIGRSCLRADVSYFLCCTRRQRTTKS